MPDLRFRLHDHISNCVPKPQNLSQLVSTQRFTSTWRNIPESRYFVIHDIQCADYDISCIFQRCSNINNH